MQYTVVATQLNAKGSVLHTGTHVVHNNYSIHSGAQHIHDTETFGLPEGQVASTMISVLILSTTLTSQC